MKAISTELLFLLLKICFSIMSALWRCCYSVVENQSSTFQARNQICNYSSDPTEPRELHNQCINISYFNVIIASSLNTVLTHELNFWHPKRKSSPVKWVMLHYTYARIYLFTERFDDNKEFLFNYFMIMYIYIYNFIVHSVYRWFYTYVWECVIPSINSSKARVHLS